ncbi:MAG: hypothetical protein ACQEQV_08090 [Fibrobacterota bacterium]
MSDTETQTNGTYYTDPEKVSRDSIMLAGCTDPEIAQALAVYGYTAERIAEGVALGEEAQRLIAAQKREYGEKLAATDELYAAREEAYDAYITALKVARIALRGDVGARETLDLEGVRERSFAGLISQAQGFYRNIQASEEWLEAMRTFGFTPEKLAEKAALVDAAAEAKTAQERESGESQETTHARDLAIDCFLSWTSDFKEIAKIALADSPQLRERIGLLERS